jgi:aryl-alcohol dehydrogenase-like predicted oxidoreductase
MRSTSSTTGYQLGLKAPTEIGNPGVTTRRAFLRRAGYAGAAFVVGASWLRGAAVPEGSMPTRVLGRTGQRVSILGLGTAPIGEARIDRQEAERIFGATMDRGVTYIDTAYIYGHAEEVLGNLVPSRRDQLFLVTKVWTDSASRAQEMLEESLRRLKTDHVDLVHIHHIGGKEVEKVKAAEGVFPYLLKQKEAGKLKYIGLSGHARPPRFVEMLKTDQIDVVMPVMNYADRNIYNFEGTVLPECRQRNVGVVAMKVYVGIKGGFPNHRNGGVGCVTPPERLPQALAYALDLKGVSSAVIGPFTMEQTLQNVQSARAYRPLAESEREDLLVYGRQLAPTLGPRYGPVA